MEEEEEEEEREQGTALCDVSNILLEVITVEMSFK